MNINQRFKSHFNIKGGYKGGSASISEYKGKIYKLSSNENPLGASPMARQAILNSCHNLNRYPDQTDLRLRQALCTYYDDRIAEGQFICGNSGSEIINLVIQGFVTKGDQVIISSPYFVPYRSFSLWGGAEVIDIPLIGTNYELDVDGIVSACNDKTRIIYLTSPNNPTGMHIPSSTLYSLLERIPSDVVILYDEVYWQFVDTDDYLRGIDLIDRFSNLIAVNSFSKAFGLAALRIGYGYMSQEVADYLRQVCRPFLISKLNLNAAIAALSDDVFIKETVALIKTERAYLKKAFTLLNIEYADSQANFFFISPPIDSVRLVKELALRGILIRPLDNFGAPGFVRISVGDRIANDALIVALKEIL